MVDYNRQTGGSLYESIKNQGSGGDIFSSKYSGNLPSDFSDPSVSYQSADQITYGSAAAAEIGYNSAADGMDYNSFKADAFDKDNKDKNAKDELASMVEEHSEKPKSDGGVQYNSSLMMPQDIQSQFQHVFEEQHRIMEEAMRGNMQTKSEQPRISGLEDSLERKRK